MPEARKPLDTTAAEAYEKFLVPTLNAPVAVDIVELASPQPGEQVLDVACGTGIAVRLVAPHVAPGGRVVGLDIDHAMIAVAQSLAPSVPGVNVEWRCASAMEMPFETGSFDLALCLQGLQYLPNYAAGLAEIRRVLKSDGRLVAAVWRSLEECRGQRAIVQALVRRDVDVTLIRKAYSMGDPERVRKLAGDAGFRKLETRTASTTTRFASAKEFVEALAAGGPSSRLALSKVPGDQRSGFFEEIGAALRQYEDKNGLTLPLGYLVLVARS